MTYSNDEEKCGVTCIVTDRALCRIDVILNWGALFDIWTMLVVFSGLFFLLLDCSISLLLRDHSTSSICGIYSPSLSLLF